MPLSITSSNSSSSTVSLESRWISSSSSTKRSDNSSGYGVFNHLIIKSFVQPLVVAGGIKRLSALNRTRNVNFQFPGGFGSGYNGFRPGDCYWFGIVALGTDWDLVRGGKVWIHVSTWMETGGWFASPKTHSEDSDGVEGEDESESEKGFKPIRKLENMRMLLDHYNFKHYIRQKKFLQN
ncbi:hypothetical protein LOTGIDRAFT_171077 [Lottia gigantea]|uniref:Uncharacterized protein n=1 Tax=Lottia gigantea TaxID=225164 RepID=V4B9K8_LOTGI|nr:hypothetical protein LOTGIDRAFT_171077 [Lottia gigantea]ESP04106.1 hypothetical protein LOTGIDRAFT_171077 [Lottia gigantea]